MAENGRKSLKLPFQTAKQKFRGQLLQKDIQFKIKIYGLRITVWIDYQTSNCCEEFSKEID
jgi:hypothetical protein